MPRSFLFPKATCLFFFKKKAKFVLLKDPSNTEEIAKQLTAEYHKTADAFQSILDPRQHEQHIRNGGYKLWIIHFPENGRHWAFRVSCVSCTHMYNNPINLKRWKYLNYNTDNRVKLYTISPWLIFQEIVFSPMMLQKEPWWSTSTVTCHVSHSHIRSLHSWWISTVCSQSGDVSFWIIKNF